jgi:GTP-binding protein HflX
VLERRLTAALPVVEVELDSGDGARLAWLYRHGTVLDRQEVDGRTQLRVVLSPAARARLAGRFPTGAIVVPAAEIPPGGR